MNTIQEQFDAAKAAALSSNFSKAEELYKNILTQQLQPEEKATILLYCSPLLWRRGSAQEGLSYAREALSIAEELGNKQIQAKAYLNIGNAMYYLSEFETALESYRQSLEMYKELEDNVGIAQNLNNLGIIYSNLSELQNARKYYYQALDVYEALNDKNGIAMLLGNIGIIHENLSDYARALEYYHKSLAIDKELDNKTQMVDKLTNIGNVYNTLSDYGLALEYHFRALSISEELGNKVGIAMSFGNIGGIYSTLSDHALALQYYLKALAINEQINDKGGVANSLSNIAYMYISLEDYQRALQYFYEALALHKKIGYKKGIENNLSNIGVAYRKLRDYDRALDFYHQALAISEELENSNDIASNLQMIGMVYYDTCNYSMALQYLQRSLIIFKELGIKRRESINLSNIAQVYAKKDFADYNPVLAEEYFLKATSLMTELGIKQELYELYQSLSDLYKNEARWQEYAEYLKKYYETEKEVQTEEVKKQADKFAFERQIAVMEKEREVTDMLLHKFLPSPIVPEVKAQEGKILVKKYNSISVLFADIVGFTKLTLQTSPDTIIEMLNYIFTKFDTIIKEAGGHRLRTIGDGYFAICGAPDTVENHQYKLAKAALAMQEDIILPKYIKQELPEGTELDIRIGLHCGEAVCGMVGGLEKWQYDAYGDTINTASRMESHGEPGKIQVSEEFKNALSGYIEFSFIPREPLYIKGKGMMNTFFLS